MTDMGTNKTSSHGVQGPQGLRAMREKGSPKEKDGKVDVAAPSRSMAGSASAIPRRCDMARWGRGGARGREPRWVIEEVDGQVREGEWLREGDSESRPNSRDTIGGPPRGSLTVGKREGSILDSNQRPYGTPCLFKD